MVNCAHPTHFEDVLAVDEPWVGRIRGLRANASRRSHAELDEAEDLDDGDPDELGADYARLRAAHPQLTVLGGCCGTDDRHVAAICLACAWWRLGWRCGRAGHDADLVVGVDMATADVRAVAVDA